MGCRGQAAGAYGRLGVQTCGSRTDFFLKYISDAFQTKYEELEATKDTEYTDPEDRDEYSAANIFWVPKEARWAKLQSSAKQQTIEKIVDDAMVAIEKENPTLKGVLPKDDSRPSLDKYRNDLYKDLRADFILANPPFNMSDWGGERLREDARWKYGIPPVNNANYAWIQHFIHHLSPTGVAGFVMANGSMSTNTTSEGEIRRNIIEADLVDCMISLPGQLFYTTQIPVCLWFLARNKKNGKFRDRRGRTLFIDARKLGSLIDRTHKDFSDEEIDKVAATYHAWRGEKEAGEYRDVPGFCKSATTEEIREHGYVLTPGRYVGAAEIEDDGVPFEEKMAELSATLYEQFAEADRLETTIKRNLEVLGYGK